jgi:hypothetical protein
MDTLLHGMVIDPTGFRETFTQPGCGLQIHDGLKPTIGGLFGD